MQNIKNDDTFSTEDELFEPMENIYNAELESLEKLDVFTTLKCPVCLDLTLEMYIDSCQHPICHLCIDQLFKTFPVNNTTFQNMQCATCPICKFVIVKERMQKLRFIKEIINMKQITCEFKENGCSFKGTFKEFHTSHKHKCKYKIIKCRLFPCKFMSKVYEVQKHEENCKFQILDCETCDESFIKPDLERHKKTCPKI